MKAGALRQVNGIAKREISVTLIALIRCQNLPNKSVSRESSAISKMAFEFRAWLFVLAGYWVCACVQGDGRIFLNALRLECNACFLGWLKPELIDIGNPDVKLGESSDAFVIEIAEEIKNSSDNGIKLNYEGL